MDLIERYLNEIKFWLPGSQSEDVIQELGEDLRSQIEEKESELGRELTEAEVAEILKIRGQPAIVAARYLPIQHVVGPTLFPFYWNTLRACFIGMAVVHIIIATLKAVSSSNPVTGFISAVPNFISSAIWTIGIMTIVFTVLEYYQMPSAKLGDWIPQSLPSIDNKARISRVCSGFELFFNLVFLGWWVGLGAGFPGFVDLPAKALLWMPVAIWRDFTQTYHLHVLVLTTASLILTSINLARPYWTKPRLGVKAVIDALLSVLFFTVINHHWPEVKAQWTQVTGGHHGLTQDQIGSAWVNIGICSGFLVAAFSMAGSALKSMWRISRW